jgi:hypothetical protein
MWEVWDTADLFLVCAGFEVQRGALVQNRPLLIQAEYQFPGLCKALSGQVKPGYGLLVSPRWPAAKLGLFQSHDFGISDDQDIVAAAALCLIQWLEAHPEAEVHMEAPWLRTQSLVQSLDALVDNSLILNLWSVL